MDSREEERIEQADTVASQFPKKRVLIVLGKHVNASGNALKALHAALMRHNVISVIMSSEQDKTQLFDLDNLEDVQYEEVKRLISL